MTRERLTKHQHRIYTELQTMSTRARERHSPQARERARAAGYPATRAEDGWVPAAEIGAAGACQHLVDKGWVEVEIERGPRGGEHRWFRPLGA